jgi:CheY-like chemotaxis protein
MTGLLRSVDPDMSKEVTSVSRILLVDDNLHGLTARKLILMEQGFDVQVALSGEQAWEMFCLSTYDVVVTDFRMSGMDGVELIARIRASDSPAATILLSGFAGCLGMTERSTGADQIVCKGTREVQDLLRAVKRLTAHPPRRKGPRSQVAPRAVAFAAASRE